LHRLEAGKKFAGVCAGLAEYFKLDPVIVRLVFVGLALLNGVGIVLYIVAWIVLPKKVA
jgi:phage shock protein C